MSIKHIILPVRPQPDTLVAIFLLKKFGASKFIDVSNAKVMISPHGKVPDAVDEESICIDCGGGHFDHHVTDKQTTAAALVAKFLGIDHNPAIKKMLAYAERDDFFGEGIRSKDPINRAFGLSGLVSALNKKYPHDPEFITQVVMPLFEAHYDEEYRRTVDTPQTLEELKRMNKFVTTAVSASKGTTKETVKVCAFESDNIHLGGYLRSSIGGLYDIVIQKRESGHINILTRPQSEIDLATIAGLVRLEELRKTSRDDGTVPDADLVLPGKLEFIPEWYYDPMTKTLQNGGINPDGVPATSLSMQDALDCVTLSLYSK
jgi:hypothetical protein